MGASIYLDLRENLLKGERLVDKCLNDPRNSGTNKSNYRAAMYVHMYVHDWTNLLFMCVHGCKALLRIVRMCRQIAKGERFADITIKKLMFK